MKNRNLIGSKLGYTTASNYSAIKYIVGMKLDKNTGELTKAGKGVKPFIDYNLIAEEEKYDGYDSIVTSESDMSDEEIVDHFK